MFNQAVKVSAESVEKQNSFHDSDASVSKKSKNDKKNGNKRPSLLITLGSPKSLLKVAPDVNVESMTQAELCSIAGREGKSPTFIASGADGKAIIVKKRSLTFRHNSWFRPYWDSITILALVFVASVTPVEVAFLSEPGDVLKWFNQLVDIVFCIDILFNFLTPYEVRPGVYEERPHMIAKHYMTHWFLIDLVSVLPFNMVKMVRLVRLAKLLRIFRANRVLKRLETRISISRGLLTLVKYMISMLLLAHWLACLFRLTADLEDSDRFDDDGHYDNWLEGYFVNNLGQYDQISQVGWADQYNAALYWAVMTVTTIGYGDVVPKTTAERWVSIFGMMVGGAAYAYIVGSVCGLVASMGELKALLNRKIDDLNVFMEEQGMPSSRRVALREYFLYTSKMEKNHISRRLMDEMSPQMRMELYCMINEKWVDKLPFLKCASELERHRFVGSLCMSLEPKIFPPGEKICHPGEIARCLYIVEAGVVVMVKSYFDLPEDNPSFLPEAKSKKQTKRSPTAAPPPQSQTDQYDEERATHRGYSRGCIW